MTELLKIPVKIGLGCIALVASFPLAAYGHYKYGTDSNSEIESYSDRVGYVFCNLTSLITNF